MRCITTWRPWGMAMMVALKSIETRNHNRLRGLVGFRFAIHNSLKWDPNAKETMRPYLPRLYMGCTLFDPDHPLNAPGVVIGSVRAWRHSPLVRILENKMALCETAGKFGLFVRAPFQTLFPRVVKGHQGIWNYDPPAEPGMEDPHAVV